MKKFMIKRKATLVLLFIFFYNISLNAQSWTKIDSPTQDNIHTIYFVNENTGFIGDDYNIYKTTDGGSHWKEVSAPYIVHEGISAIFFPNDMIGFAVGPPAGIGQENIILKTVDGGDNWTKLNAVSAGKVIPVMRLLCVFFINANVGYISGFNMWGSSIYKTTDGGVTWNKSYYYYKADYINSIYFYNNNIGYSVGGMGEYSRRFIVKTNDAGSNWNIQANNNNNKGCLHSIVGITSTSAISVGDHGAILRTTDGGNDWNTISAGTNNKLNCVCFASSNEGYIAGNGGVILKTTNAGISWNNMNSGISNNLYSICFPSSTIGYAAGEKGVILKYGFTSGNQPNNAHSNEHQPSSDERQITVNQMPSSFFANWYSTDGNNVWAYGITKNYFRTNDIFYNYDGIYKSNDNVYTIKISSGSDYRTYYVKDIGSDYIKIGGSNGQFTLFKSNTNLSNSEHSNGHQPSSDERQITVYGGGGTTGTFTDPRDGKTYKWVKIGEQVWMAENLNYTGCGTHITDDDEWYHNLDYDGWCYYDNNENYADTYGVLYQWKAAKTACPVGWHLPTDEEWTQLVNYLRENGFAYDSYDGIVDRFGIAKSLAADNGWSISDKPGAVGNSDFPAFRNKSGFSALPGGIRSCFSYFRELGDYGYWWSATESSSDSAYSRCIYYNYNAVYHDDYDNIIMLYGLSVRCVRD